MTGSGGPGAAIGMARTGTALIGMAETGKAMHSTLQAPAQQRTHARSCAAPYWMKGG